MNEERTPTRDSWNDKFIELKAVCLERWGAVPSPKDEDIYNLAPPSDFATDLNVAVSRLYENTTFQNLSDDERQEVVQDLVWFINDRWIGWQSSPHRDLIVDAIQQTDMAAELDYKYVINIGEETFINSQSLEGYLFPVDMFRVRNHLRAGEMVILISKTGVIGVAHASEEQRVLTIVDLPVKDSALQHGYKELARKMKDLADLESQGETFKRAFQHLQLAEFSDLTGSEQTVEGLRKDWSEHLEAVERKRQELSNAYRSYSEDAALALSDLVERHQSQAIQISDPDGGIQSTAIRGLVRLSKYYKGDLDRMEAEGVIPADFLAPARLLRQIQFRAGPFPSAVLVKVSEALGKFHLQTVYDCLHEAVVEGFEKPVKFVMLETREPLRLRVTLDEEFSTDDLSTEELLDAFLATSATIDRLAQSLGLAGLATVDTASSTSLMAALEQAQSQEKALVLALYLIRLGPSGIGSLVDAVGHSNELVHMAAHVALVRAGTNAIPQLLEALGSPDLEWCSRIAAILVHIGEPALEPLLSTLSSPDIYQRAGAMIALSFFDKRLGSVPWDSVEESTILRLADDVSHSDAHIKAAVWMFMFALGPRAIDPLIRCLEKVGESDVSEVVAVLAEIGESAVEPLIQRLKKTKEPGVSRIAAALGVIGEPAIEPLIEVLASSSEEVSTRAAGALAMIGKAAKRRLENLLIVGNTQQKIMAMVTLEMIEKHSRGT